MEALFALCSCVPAENQPVAPRLFVTLAAAEKALAETMRGEWESNRPEDDEGRPIPMPEDVSEAVDLLEEILGPEWGRWEIFPVAVEGDASASRDPLADNPAPEREERTGEP